MTADVRLARLLADTVADLRRRGIEATVDTLDTAGRPDALVLVETGSAGVEAWYCQPGSSASTKLASALVASAGALTATESASSDPQEIEPLLPCDRILDGRASTAAVLVRLPEDASGPRRRC